MRTIKHERPAVHAPHVTFVHYDVPHPDLGSMVDQLGSIAYTRGTSVMSQASDDYLLADPDSENEDLIFSADEDEESLAGAVRESLEDGDARDAASDLETVYWSTEEDVVSLPSPHSVRACLLTSAAVWAECQADQATEAQVLLRHARALSRLSGEVPRSSHAPDPASTRNSVAARSRFSVVRSPQPPDGGPVGGRVQAPLR
jgi:hypothetical protein